MLMWCDGQAVKYGFVYERECNWVYERGMNGCMIVYGMGMRLGGWVDGD